MDPACGGKLCSFAVLLRSKLISKPGSGGAALGVLGVALGLGLAAGFPAWSGARRPVPVGSDPTQA
jgi:hypothetical protein